MANKPTFMIEQVQTQAQSFLCQIKTYEITDKYQPEAHFELDVQNRLVAENRYEVTLSVDVTVKQSDKEVFKVSVAQAGLFQIAGYDSEKNHILESFCPNILHPYAREAISSMVAKAGFPVFNLPPFDFESRYRQMNETPQKENEKDN